MNRRPSSAPPDAMDDLLRSALASQAQPDAETLAQLRRQMRAAQPGMHGRAGAESPDQPKHNNKLLWLAAAGGTAMTAAMVFALTVLFPNQPWKQAIQALGSLFCVCTWLLTALSSKLAPTHLERIFE